MRPEDAARTQIDALLTQAGWAVQDRKRLNLGAARGIAIREHFNTSYGTTAIASADHTGTQTVLSQPIHQPDHHRRFTTPPRSNIAHHPYRHLHCK